MKQSDERKDRAGQPAREAMRLHPFYRGKIETALHCPVRDYRDFAIWYSPGVAAPCRAIAENPELVYEHTAKGNTIAVISDGTRVLGMGNIGPRAGLPVMEGKALLFKYLGGVDAVPLMLDTENAEKMIETVLMLQPSFGGINLEDIASPRCFRVLEQLRERAEIPVWHDDQQGTATVTLAGLINAFKVTGKSIGDARIAFVGSGASNLACARLIFARGADPALCRVVDSRGLLHPERDDVRAKAGENPAKWDLCGRTNREGRRGGIEDALRGADAVIALSKPGPGVIEPDWIRGMAPDPIVFACANPEPEIWPWDAREAGAAVVATGRSDFPNQVNNSLGFPGIFRGALDVRASTITDEMCFAAADALAGAVGDRLAADCILPTMEDREVFALEAAAVGRCAVEQGLAVLSLSREELLQSAREKIERAVRLTDLMMESGLIPEAPTG
jgi:malate dehydrogenase (oxaloacetate-decarboxylating)